MKLEQAELESEAQEDQESLKRSTGIQLLADMFLSDQSNEIFAPKPNIADMFSDAVLLRVGSQAKKGYEADVDSMSDWNELVEFGLDLVEQETKSKSTPWEGASNFKSPELMKAALKFSDRASSELLRGYNILKTKVVGDDPNNLKFEKGERVAEFSNWQLNVEMPEWRDEHEKLIYDLPYVGTVFKKTFFDAQLGRNTSSLICYPNFAVNQHAESITRLRRFSISHNFSANEVEEKKREGVWLDIELSLGDTEKEESSESESDKFTTFIEQDGYFDLDDDGYEEPYTFVFQESTGKIVRITARFEPSDVLIKDDVNLRAQTLAQIIKAGVVEQLNESAKVVRISATGNITKYGFIRDPQGGFLDVGYTHLLSAIVSGVNATTNQLVDAGTLANLQGGWLAKGFRRKMGDSSFKPGQWKETGISAQILQSGIMPIMHKEPSQTLLALMQFMISNAQELAASTDLKGALGANAPVGTTLAMIDEQMQGTGAIVKRIYRSMASEFRKLNNLNAKFVDPLQYQEILDDPNADFEQDFNLRGMDIVPVANPEISTKTQRIMQANAEMGQLQFILMAGGDVRPLIKNFFDAIGSSIGDQVFPDEAPEQMLQRLLSENPQLQELITNEQQRLVLLQAAQEEAVEREQSRKDAETAASIDKDDADTRLKEAQRIKTLEQAETESTKNQIDTYTAAGKIDAQELQNQKTLQQLQQPQELNNGTNQGRPTGLA